MAKVPDSRLTALKFTGGIDNRSHETQLDPTFVRRAENVDIDIDGVVTVRQGYAQIKALANAHSLWGSDLLAFCLVADSTSLYALYPDGALDALVTGLAGSDMSYALVAGRVHWSNGYQSGVITSQGIAMPWGVEAPLPSFSAAPSSTGGMFGGTYGVTVTFANALREESGASGPVFVDVPDGGGIQLRNVPAPLASGPVEARVYVTTANGTDLQYFASCAPGASSFSIGAHAPGRLLTTLFHDQFPPSKFLLAKHGRIFGAIKRQVMWSHPMYYGLYDNTKNFLMMPGDVTMLAAPESPRFIVYVSTASKVYALQGDSIATATLSVVSNQGAIPGSMAMLPAEVMGMESIIAPVPVWVGGDGLPYAGTDQGVLPLHKVFTYPIFDKASAIFAQTNGDSRYIVSGRGGRPSGLVATDTFVAAVYNNGGGN